MLKALSYLKCPMCGGPLEVGSCEQKHANKLWNGTVVCQRCKGSRVVREGVLDLEVQAAGQEPSTSAPREPSGAPSRRSSWLLSARSCRRRLHVVYCEPHARSRQPSFAENQDGTSGSKLANPAGQRSKVTHPRPASTAAGEPIHLFVSIPDRTTRSTASRCSRPWFRMGSHGGAGARVGSLARLFAPASSSRCRLRIRRRGSSNATGATPIVWRRVIEARRGRTASTSHG